MNFAEIIYQAILFTATFFIFNKIFNRFIFKNRQEIPLSLNRLFMMFSLYLVMSTTLQYFFPRAVGTDTNSQVATLQSGQSMTVASTSVDLQGPLNTALHMKTEPTSTIVVENNEAMYEFAIETATLQSVFATLNGKQVAVIQNSIQNCAIAIADQVPDAFALVSNEQTGHATRELIFKAPYRLMKESGIIQKKFTMYQNSYQIDLEVSVTNILSDQLIRLFIAMPENNKQLHAVANKNPHSKSPLAEFALDKSANFERFWFEPMVYGFSSIYFSHVCFAYSPLALGRAYLRSMDSKQYQAIFETKKLSGDVVLSWSFYCGPNCPDAIVKVCPALDGLVDYGFFGFIARPLAKLLDWIQLYTGNYGWAILLIALLVKILTIPLALRSERALKEQAEFEKKRLHLQQKFKHDKAALDQATAELISKHGLPMITGCLPMLINIPMFWALNQVLSRCTQLYGVSFLWIPDLSQSDPYYILPILTFIGMVFTPNPQVGPRQMMSKIGFALLLAAITSYLASGLAMFIMVNTVFGLIQNSLVRYARVIVRMQ